MPQPHDNDLQLQSLRDDLRARIVALNELHHPVYPAAPSRIAECERRVEEIRVAIAARRRDLTPSAP
jgi:hypothetical protein